MDNSLQWPDQADSTGAAEADGVDALTYELYEAGGRENVLLDMYRKQAEAAKHPLPRAAKRPLPGWRRKLLMLGQHARRLWLQVTGKGRTGEKLLILVRHARRIREVAKPEKDQRMEGWSKWQRPSPKVEEDDGKSTRKSG